MNTEIKEIQPEETLVIRQKVMWPDKNIDFVRVEKDKDGKHFALIDNGKMVSIISIFYKNNEVQFRKFATLTEEQGKGYGTMLLNFVFKNLEKNGIKKIWCNARKSKVEFYKRFGMQETEKTFVKEGIEYVIMEKNYESATHLS